MKPLNYVLFAMLLVLPIMVNSQLIKTINDKPIIAELDEVRPFSEGLAAVRRGNQWGFIDTKGQLVIDFRDDLVWDKAADTANKDVSGIRYPEFKEGLCLNKSLTPEGIALYGFIDKTGQQAIAIEYVNITQFKDDLAIGIFTKKTFKGQNEIKLNVFEYRFIEVVLNRSGEILWPISERNNILMSTRRFELPVIQSKLISQNLLVTKNESNNWEVHQLSL